MNSLRVVDRTSVRGRGHRYRRRLFSRGGRKNKRSPTRKGEGDDLTPSTSKSVQSSTDSPPRRWGFLTKSIDPTNPASVPGVIMISSDKLDSESNHLLTTTDIDSDSGSDVSSSESLSSFHTLEASSDVSIEASDVVNGVEKPLVSSCKTGSIPESTDVAEKATVINQHSVVQESIETKHSNQNRARLSFAQFRTYYLIVHVAIMLADGLQGTHLYVLYEGYGYSVASLYSLGFISGAVTSPFIGPIVDGIGRKKAAMLYCILEIIINYMEQFPLFTGLIISRMIGGITTNLLFSVFESWLVTEHRKHGFEEEKLEIILRDSTIVSNSAAIASGYIAHSLASALGPVGPFEGAVTFTWIALVLVGFLWTENYGSNDPENTTSFRSHMVGAYRTITGDSRISRTGLIQGLTEGTLQTFVFLWSPALRSFCVSAPHVALGLDENGEPAYGLIFGGFMACGVVGGVIEPCVRRIIHPAKLAVKVKREGDSNATDVGILCAICYLLSAMLLLVPCLLDKESPYSFSVSLAAFSCYEVLVGIYMPCEGMIRSIFMPNESICSLMTMLRVIVNVAVALGVISTNYVSFTSAFGTLSVMMVVAACLQISIIPKKELLRALHC